MRIFTHYRLRPTPSEGVQEGPLVDHSHPHPGEIIKEDVLEPLGLTVTEAAERLGMTRPNLSRVLNGKTGISPDLALRLQHAGVSTARFWMDLQTNYELAQAARRPQPPVKPLSTARSRARCSETLQRARPVAGHQAALDPSGLVVV